MKLRAIIKTNLEEISALGIQSKSIWGYNEEMMAIFAEELTLSESQLDLLFDAQLALIENTIVGYFTLHYHEADNVTELEHLFVHPEFLRMGIGKFLLNAAIESARKTGATELKIISDPNARDFYIKMGAKPVGEHHSVDIPGRVIPIVSIEL